MKGCEVVWAIRHNSICHTFVDEGAAVFFLPHLEEEDSLARGRGGSAGPQSVKRTKYVYEHQTVSEGGGGRGMREGGEGGGGGEVVGSALGPDWQTSRQLRGSREVIT